MAEGDFVCYTTNAEGSTLRFGTIAKINAKSITRYKHDIQNLQNRTSYQDMAYTIVIAKTDVNRQPEFVEDYDPGTRQYITTNIQQKSGRIDYSPHKFLIMP